MQTRLNTESLVDSCCLTEIAFLGIHQNDKTTNNKSYPPHFCMGYSDHSPDDIERLRYGSTGYNIEAS